jgi:hypothetical protein
MFDGFSTTTTRRVGGFISVIALFLALVRPAAADPMGSMSMPAASTQTQTAGPYTIQLVLLPAEPFITQAEYAQTHPAEGMVVVGGAVPVQPASATQPNHHLVAHIYRADGTAVEGAHVAMTVVATGGAAPASPMPVPIVEMQAAGKGPQSTHYGNNVTLAPGTYNVTVSVGETASTTFALTVK